MRIILPDKGQEYVLEFENEDEYQHFFNKAYKHGYFLLKISKLPGQPIFRARCLGSPRSRKLIPHRLTLTEPGLYRIDIVPPPPPVAGAEAVGEKPSEAEPQKERQSSETIQERVKALSMNEKVTLALRADLMERRALMQENNLKINEFLLRNPRLSEQEIVWLARNPSLPTQTLLAIVRHSAWMKLLSVRTAILMNPRTPGPTVLEMIPSATEADLIKLHNSSELRTDVKAAVVREVRKRGINPKRVMD